MKTLPFLTLAALLTVPSFGSTPKSKPLGEPMPGDPITVQMGQRKPVRIRVAVGQATLIRLPDGQRVMNVYGGDKGEGGDWSIDAGKVPTRFLAVKPKEAGIHTTLHIVSNNGKEVSLYLQEVTGIESQFDAEVDAEDSTADSNEETSFAEVKWVPADDVKNCKTAADAHSKEAIATAKAAEEKAEKEAADFQVNYPKNLHFDFRWDDARARRLGFTAAWADEKFTYFRSNRVLALYEINEDGKPSLIQYSYANGLYVVPKLIYDGYFAIGEKKHNKLTFHREKS